MKKQFNLLVILFLSLLFSGCSVVQQTYDFYHHGTDSINTSKNFRYLEKNVMGKSKVTYKISNWNRMKQDMVLNGMMSQAKENLPELGDNQAFANLSVDVVTTKKGTPNGGVASVSEITLEVVVSADIIEYY
tara:strand:- start:216 stop:611 length:396 start_codon:yes stop_codon:yes gene_type:complete